MATYLVSMLARVKLNARHIQSIQVRRNHLTFDVVITAPKNSWKIATGVDSGCADVILETITPGSAVADKRASIFTIEGHFVAGSLAVSHEQADPLGEMNSAENLRKESPTAGRNTSLDQICDGFPGVYEFNIPAFDNFKGTKVMSVVSEMDGKPPLEGKFVVAVTDSSLAAVSAYAQTIITGCMDGMDDSKLTGCSRRPQTWPTNRNFPKSNMLLTVNLRSPPDCSRETLASAGISSTPRLC